jgi:nucleoside-diphosphate-sugar epimerase
MKLLVTGGAGYIGSHTVVELLAGGHDVVIVDNLCNSKASVIDRVAVIAGRRPAFVHADIRDGKALRAALAGCQAVIHFAGLKAVGESVAKPIEYYDNNVAGSVNLFEAMRDTSVKTLVFSSSATVYGDPHAVPIREDFPLSATNPYGRSKLMIEEMLRDVVRSDDRWRIALLRYFNPVGAHPSGTIGEDPNGIPNNLMPFVAQVAAGKLPQLSVFGDDYPPPGPRVTRLRPPCGARRLGDCARCADGQPRHRTRLFSSGNGARLREGQRQAGTLPDRAASCRRYRRVLRRPLTGRPTSAVACRARHRRHVRRHLALAAMGCRMPGRRVLNCHCVCRCQTAISEK